MTNMKRSTSFPPDFIFGVATSAIQVEGGSAEGERGIGVWDTFCKNPGAIKDGTTPATTCDHFHKYKEDIAELKRLGVDTYRFSISWPRLFPDASGKLNQDGVSFYNNLIGTIVEVGLIPFVTLYHWDLPQYLQDDPHVKGWGTRHIIKHFMRFADACFRCFGDRVKHWITFNEIHLSTILSYHFGFLAPGKSPDLSVTLYVAAHHQLLCHAAVVKLYKESYKILQKGLIGISADVTCFEPMFGTEEDKAAVTRSQEFEMGWILDPLLLGDYPEIMKELAGDKLPRFTDEEIEDLKQSIDFIGLNYYYAMWVTKRKEETPFGLQMWREETQTEFHWYDADGKPLGEILGDSFEGLFRSCPWGLRKVLKTLKDRYGDIPIYITENGTVDPKPSDMLHGPLIDHNRIKFLKDHLSEISDSIRLDNVNVKGYFHWTFMDDWEWLSGFTTRYGLYHVDFTDPELPRKPKASATWLSSFLQS